MSLYNEGKTICAIATPLGQGGISIIRLSGEESLPIAKKIFSCGTAKIEPRRMILGKVMDGEDFLDEVLLCYFNAPFSYTGENVVEFQSHGGPIITDKILRLLLQNGASLAEPGEFSKRAFLNGKMDLSKAEAVADLIGALGEKSVMMAAAHLEGRLGNRIRKIQDLLTDGIAAMEAGIEYPEEDLEESIASEQMPALLKAEKELADLLATYHQGKMIRDGVQVAIIGRPNVGKSSLLNAFLNEERAIVTDVPGTTRDVVKEYALLKGIPVVFIDTAGIRNTEDIVEKIGVERSREAAIKADVVLFLLDSGKEIEKDDILLFEEIKSLNKPMQVILSKSDLKINTNEEEVYKIFQCNPIKLSVLNGEGVKEIENGIYSLAISDELLQESLTISNERHYDAISRAERALTDAISELRGNCDLDCAAIDLRTAWESIGEITGVTVGEEIIDRIFTKFCLGK